MPSFRELWDEMRLLIAVKLIALSFRIAPKDHPDTQALASAIGSLHDEQQP